MSHRSRGLTVFPRTTYPTLMYMTKYQSFLMVFVSPLLQPGLLHEVVAILHSAYGTVTFRKVCTGDFLQLVLLASILEILMLQHLW